MTQQSPSPLFREEAVRAQRTTLHGEIILVRPATFMLLTGIALIVCSVIVVFFALGTYTRHTTLSGQLVPDVGVITVHAPQFGIIAEKTVSEGDIVERGDVLYVVSSERLSTTLGATQELIGEQLAKQEQSLYGQIEQARIREEADRESLGEMISAVEAEMVNIHAMIDSQHQRIDLAEETALRYATMREEGFVSIEQLIAKQEVLLEQRSRLQSLERERSNATRQLADLENQALGVPFNFQNQLAEYERAIAATRRELSENEARRRVLVTAPESGIATAVVGEIGQVVDSSRVLLSIVPEKALLQAHLYATSNAVGFIDVGSTVLLRFQAYPYQKFGHQEGTISSVSRTAMSTAGLPGGGAGQGSEPLYRVTVELSSQNINAYGEPHQLLASMTLQGDVLQETRRLYEWILEPLYTLTGTLYN